MRDAFYGDKIYNYCCCFEILCFKAWNNESNNAFIFFDSTNSFACHKYSFLLHFLHFAWITFLIFNLNKRNVNVTKNMKKEKCRLYYDVIAYISWSSIDSFEVFYMMSFYDTRKESSIWSMIFPLSFKRNNHTNKEKGRAIQIKNICPLLWISVFMNSTNVFKFTL